MMIKSATKSKLILPKNIWDGKKVEEKDKKEIEKVPQPTGFRMVLFPLKLEEKTSSGIIFTEDTIEQAQISRIKIEGGELRIINDDEILATLDDPRDVLPANIF